MPNAAVYCIILFFGPPLQPSLIVLLGYLCAQVIEYNVVQ
jgi:hypothetical protein